MPDPLPTGDQFYVTHCAAADSVLNDPGYTVRAASVTTGGALDAAFRYPPYELPIDLWRDLPPVPETPRRLALTAHPDGGLWAAHSAYLAKDTVGRDRSYFSHLVRLLAVGPATVLRSWGAEAWASDYAPGAPRALPPSFPLPVGTLVSDIALTAFLGDVPTGPTELSVTVCPPRLRRGPGERRELFARVVCAVLRMTELEGDRRRLYVHAEPGLVALLLYGAVRLLPRSAMESLTFSTFEPYHRNIRNYKLADVVGTYLGAPDKGLEADLGTARGVALDTFDLKRSSPELARSLGELLPPGLSDLIKLVARGAWDKVDEIHRTVGGEWDVRAWLTEAGSAARGETRPAPPPAPEPLSLDDAQAPAPAPTPTVATPPTPAKPAAQPLPPSRPVGGMTYAAQISRTNPACLLFLVDQSKSMAEPFVGGLNQTKASVVADALNRLIQNVVLRSAKADGVRDYFRVGVLGYGQGVKAGLGGTVPHKVLIPVSELGAHPLRVETRTKLIPDGVGGVVEQKVKFPVWFDAEASGQTPMCEAFAAAGLAVKGFVDEFPNAFPPLVLNLTDGMPSDGNPQYHARTLCNMGTSDGATLLFNLLISSKPVQADFFPSAEDNLPDVCSKLLFRMASVLPPKFFDAAKAEGHDLKPQARGVVINADPTAIVRFLDIGTRVTPSGR